MWGRWIRITILTLLLAALPVAAFLLRTIEQQSNTLTTIEDAVAERLERAADGIEALGLAQQGYVAPGQLDEPWFEQVTATLQQVRENLGGLPPLLRSAEAATGLVALTTSVDAFAAADMRVRENLARGEELMAADVIFSDGRKLVDAMITQAHGVSRAERGFLRGSRTALDRDRWSVLGLVFVVWLATVVIVSRTGKTSRDDHLHVVDPAHIASAPLAQPAPPPALPVDLAATATLCTDLSRVADTNALARLLSRTATVLDASGVALWLGAGDRLFAVMGHGYPEETLARFGPIARGADNAVARTWRTGRLATVAASATGPAGLVAPMFGPAGCFGVLAIERGGEPDSTVQAVAGIIAAQVATAVSAWPAASSPDPSAKERSARTA
jgi:hypothetical protein